MEESILKSIKKMLLGIDGVDVTEFDSDIILLINASFSALFQMGIGTKPYYITGPDETWDGVLTNESYLETIRRYVYIDVKLVFDPPASSIVTEALKEQKKEDAWRITSEIDMINKEITK